MQNKVADLQDELVERMEENAKELKRRDRTAQDNIGEKMDARNREMSRFQRENKFLEKRLLELQEELQESKRVGAFLTSWWPVGDAVDRTGTLCDVPDVLATGVLAPRAAQRGWDLS